MYAPLLYDIWKEESLKSKRTFTIIAVLCALGIAGRAAFFMLPQFKPVLALTIIAGVALGGETGFLVGAITMLVSNIMFSQGPWTPWQMFAMGIIGFSLPEYFIKKVFFADQEFLFVYLAQFRQLLFMAALLIPLLL